MAASCVSAMTNLLHFKQPPLDGSLILPEILDYHAQQSPYHPIFRYADVDGIVQVISWSHAVQAFHKVPHIVRHQVDVQEPEMRPVIGIVASSDQITYLSVIAGILRAGYQAFPVSPRNSDVAIAHLLRSTNCTHLFVSADAAMQNLVRAASIKLEEELKMMRMPTFDDLFALLNPLELPPPMQKISSDAPAVILHSSGISTSYDLTYPTAHSGSTRSTAFPKTIILTYRILMETGLVPYYGQVDLCGQILSVHVHLMGLVQLPWMAFSGLTIAVFPPTSPPTVPTPDRVFSGAIETKSTLIFSWAREPGHLPALKNFKTVIFAGGSLQPEVGDMLVQNGVNIAHVYGLTETANLVLFLPSQIAPERGWDYFYLSPHISPVFLPLEDIPGYAQLLQICKTHTPAILNTVVDGVAALNTNDLFLRNPTNPNLWKVFGRLDDQIMHSTGEKAILLKDPAIKYAVMFGRGKFHAGVLIFPAEPFDPADTQHVIDFRRRIWLAPFVLYRLTDLIAEFRPTIEEANRFAPTHSRIFKEMVLVADPSKPIIELTAKGTPRRNAILDIYKLEIRNVYAAVKDSSQTHLTAPDEYDAPASLNFVRRVVAEVMLEMPGDDEDIFQHGCDSLQATWIRNSILHALRNSQRVDIKAVPNNFVYSHPTLRLLADLLTQLASGLTSEPEDISRRADAMQAMVHKYAKEFPEHHATSEVPNTEVVLVTGTTGAFGSHIIGQLLALPDISAVFVLNRPSADSSIQERQHTSFVANGIDPQLLESPKLKLLEGDLNASALGLSGEEFSAIRDRVILIVHNAWQVNFNMSLSSMEPLVSGTRHLIDFALGSPHPNPPRLIFISTAGVFRNLKGNSAALEQRVTDPQISVGLGYTESKWVAEEILETVARQTSLSPVIIRPGQLSGASNGAWNPSDWFPVLIRASQALGHLPAISGRASWVPIHHAARDLVNMRDSDDHYLHITHPHPVPMADILSALSEALDLPLVPYSTWLDSLEAAASWESEAPANAGVRLIEFFPAFFPASLSYTRASKAAKSMPSLAPLGTQDFKAWVSHLRQVGYLA
ncbi:male sterility protein-domain-containing protein [Mycena latifolia]|nr:male sterility protein-domain-containing protein [Mycena latifolia]